MNIPFKLNLFYVSKSFITGLTFFLAIALTKTAGAEVPAGPLSAESFTRHVEEQHSSKPDYRQNGASLISLSVKNASLREIAAALTKMSGKNVIADTKVQEPVTLQLENVSLHTALETLAAVQGLTYTENGSVILISRDDTLKKLSAGFYTFPLNYARAEDLQKPLSAVLNTGKLADFG